jgi:short-subunit dehydrogenase
MPRAVVTGGSSGIGLELSRRLVRRGYEVVLVARGRERLERATAELGPAATALVADVGEAGAGERIAAELEARDVRTVDLLVCNAGIPARASALTVDEERARQVIEVNYLGMVSVTRALWPRLVASRGRVVNVVSVAGTVALPAAAPYAASKHAALAWSRALAAAARPLGVRVLTVNPGPVTTDGFPQSALTADRRLRWSVIDAGTCADAIVRALDRDRTEVFVPAWWRAAAILQALAPATTARAAGRLRRR